MARVNLLENIKKEVIEKATAEAVANKLNEEQTKMFVDEALEKAIKEYEENTKKEDKKEIKNTKKEDKKEIKNTKKEDKEVVKKEKKYIVYTPVENYCGEVAGVQFAYGKAEIKAGWVLQWFKEHGYKIEEVSE